MKKLVSLLAIAALALAGCGASEPTSYVGKSDLEASGEVTNEDGDTTSVDLVVTQDGDIVSASIDATKGDITSKKEAAIAGDYDMGSDLNWAEQVASVESYIVENDAFPTLDADGKDADAVTSATIGLDGIKEAYDAAEATLSTSAQYYVVEMTKEGDDITEATLNVTSADGTYDKVAASTDGSYSMVGEVTGLKWHEQVAAVEEYIVENDAFPTLDADGYADAVSSATIHINEFEQAFNAAVEA